MYRWQGRSNHRHNRYAPNIGGPPEWANPKWCQLVTGVTVNETTNVAPAVEAMIAEAIITAPEDGTLGTVGIAVGVYAIAGSQITSLVPDRKWVIANFKETQVAAMKIGQRATFSVDALDHATVRGYISASRRRPAWNLPS